MNSAEEQFIRAGVSPAEAKILQESGFQAFAMKELPEEERLLIGRSEPANIFGPTHGR